MINLEETELRLALPGKRGFSETASVDLKLNLSSNTHLPSSTSLPSDTPIETTAPPAKAQVVGWPPVRSLRKKIVNVQRRKKEEGEGEGGVALVKVSMDGAPYLRKVDLKLYKSYQELSDALAKMLSSFTIGNCIKDFMNETKFIDLFNASHYVPTYQDKDGDWMLVGDVPWDMFVQSCNRLRIIKPSDANAIALAPRALQKCKNRS